MTSKQRAYLRSMASQIDTIFQIGKGGIVRTDAARKDAIQRVAACAEALGLCPTGLILSPIRGGDGNVEYLIHLEKLTDAARAVPIQTLLHLVGM